jgi:uncharacterized protein
MARKNGPTWQPTDEDFYKIFDEQNPWHVSGSVPDVWAREIERPAAEFLFKRLMTDEPRRFQLILGPRRVGKTTLMYQTVRRLMGAGVPKDRLWWLRLDHPLLLQMPLDQLVRYVIKSVELETRKQPSVNNPVYLFLDELTYAESWDLWLKTFYDESWPIRIAATSSSTAAMRDRLVESGVGRWEEQYLAPYLFSEYLTLMNREVRIPVKDCLANTIRACIEEKIPIDGLAEIRRRFLLVGGFPELLSLVGGSDGSDEAILLQSQRILRNDAIERAVYKDIPQAFGIDNPTLLERLLYTLAGQFTGLLSPQNICQGFDGLAQATFTRYLAYLERAFLVFSLSNFSNSEESIQKRGRKLFFVDGAVRNAALQRGIGPLNNPEEMGLLIENMAAGHLHALSSQSGHRLYHWRNKNEEVDLVYDHPEFPMAFELGLSAGHHRKGMNAFLQRFHRYEKGCYVVAGSGANRLPEESMDLIGNINFDLFLLAVGAQAQQEMSRRLIRDVQPTPTP